MANYFAVSSREEFNTRLWTRAAVDRQYNYKQTDPDAKRAVSAEKGEPPGANDGRKSYHLGFVQHWWAFEEVLAEEEGRPPNYTLIHEPPAPHSGERQQANGAKLLAFYRHILELFDADDEPVQGVNTQVEKSMLGFFEDLLAAQFADCPKDLQEYALLAAADKDAIKAVARRIDTKVRERIRSRDAYSETLGAALTEQDMLKYYNLTVRQTKGHNWANIVSLKAIFAHMFLNANRGVREIRLLLGNVVDEELERAAKVDLSGASTSRLLVHGFALQAGGPGAQDKLREKTARWELDGFLRHAILELCAASKMADYMMVRFRDLPLQPALVSAEALLDFMDTPFFMRRRHGMAPKPYSKDTVKNVLMVSGQGDGLEARAGLEHMSGKLMHRFKHGGVRAHVDLLGGDDAVRRYAKHGGKVHEASYSNRTWCPKLAMAKVAGHRNGFVQLYRAGIWCSIERDAAFKGLFDRITPVSDAQLAAAGVLLDGHKAWAGVRATLVALRNYTDIMLQDLVEWCAHPVMGADYLAATDRFPFLATKDWQHADWLSFCAASRARAAVMRDADRSRAAPEVPETPPCMPPALHLLPGAAAPPVLPPVQQLPAVEQLPSVEQLVETPPDPAACVDLVKEVPSALAAPTGGWTAAAMYARYSEPLKAGVPSLRQIMVHQGHLNWARPGKDRKAASWMNKFWSRICCEIYDGKELQQALEDAQDVYEAWGSAQRAKRAKLPGDKRARNGFKAWVEDELPPAIRGWHLL